MGRNSLLEIYACRGGWGNTGIHALAFHGSGALFPYDRALAAGVNRIGARHNMSLQLTAMALFVTIPQFQ